MSAYPNASIPREEIPWYPTIDPEKCTNCGACKEFCPNGVYAEGKPNMEVVLPFQCVVGCSGCISICTPQAISFPTDESLIANLRALRAKYGTMRPGPWSSPDPASFTGSREERLARTRQVRDAVKAKVEEFIRDSADGRLDQLDFSIAEKKDELAVFFVLKSPEVGNAMTQMWHRPAFSWPHYH
jgi:NAD-dependent dihydropyrimidine dehydrogenase PreA subunit